MAPALPSSIDSRPALGRASASHRAEVIASRGSDVPFGDVGLSPGTHNISITVHGSDLHPGSGGAAQPIGPLALTDQDAADARISYFPASRAHRLCGRRWDWIEAVSGPARAD